MEDSNVCLKIWLWSIYIECTRPKGISSIQLGHDLGVTQKTAWFILHRLRIAWLRHTLEPFVGPIEVDETLVGGKDKNRHRDKRGTIDKAIVAGIRDRSTGQVVAQVVSRADGATLRPYVIGNLVEGGEVYSDESPAYKGLSNHSSVCHSRGEYVRNSVTTNSLESFWSLFKRTYHGTYHYISPKHLPKYVGQSVGRFNIRHLPVLDRMALLTRSLVGPKINYKELVS